MKNVRPLSWWLSIALLSSGCLLNPHGRLSAAHSTDVLVPLPPVTPAVTREPHKLPDPSGRDDAPPDDKVMVFKSGVVAPRSAPHLQHAAADPTMSRLPPVATALPSSAPPARPVNVRQNVADVAHASGVPDASGVSDVSAASEPTIEVPAEVLASVHLSPSVAQRAEELMNQAIRLAERGALFSAREEYLRVMRLVAQALDSELGQRYHTPALAMGLQALDEADDFAVRGGSAARDLQLAGFVAGHRTPALKGVPLNDHTPLTAMQTYYEYAREQLRRAGNHEPVAARALYGLGRIDMLLSVQQDQSFRGGPTPVALFQAALAIDPQNADAANELGVLMARYGQLDEATRYLERCLAIRPTPIAMSNLAEVRRRQGLPAASFQAPSASVAAAPNSNVQWVDPETFARMSHPHQDTSSYR